jgi:hypothetical protein
MIGLIPFIGPICAYTLSGRVIRMAEEANIPATLQAEMTANTGFDFLVSIPLLNSLIQISLPPIIGALFQVLPLH